MADLNKKVLKKIYRQYNKREFVHPDPLEFLYKYDDVRDREILGLIASSLAYGRVQQILKSVAIVLDLMGDSPFKFVTKSSDEKILSVFKNFVHRFHTCSDISALLIGIRHVIKRHGSLRECFKKSIQPADKSIENALNMFVKEVSCESGCCMLSLPEKGSACKRLNLYLRWMVRRDEVDPGGWDDIPASKLIVPLDTHMYKVSKALGLTKRKQANLKTAIEITDGFAAVSPDDPIKYDLL